MPFISSFVRGDQWIISVGERQRYRVIAMKTQLRSQGLQVPVRD